MASINITTHQLQVLYCYQYYIVGVWDVRTVLDSKQFKLFALSNSVLKHDTVLCIVLQFEKPHKNCFYSYNWSSCGKTGNLRYFPITKILHYKINKATKEKLGEGQKKIILVKGLLVECHHTSSDCHVHRDLSRHSAQNKHFLPCVRMVSWVIHMFSFPDLIRS